MEFKDYYQTLGVARDASDDAIRRAYRKLARQYHPDVSQEANAETRMRDINEAYAVLGDADKRAAYDDVGQRAGGHGYAPPPGWEQGFAFRGGPRTGGGYADADDGFSDFFSALFGEAAARERAGRHAAHPLRGEDQHATIGIDFEDAWHGATREITLNGIYPDAQGRHAMQTRTLSVRIPAGIREGQKIRLAGQGMPGHAGGSPGDLYLDVHLNPHRQYRVEGRDVSLMLPVAPWEAALGARVQAPTPDGPVDVAIPAGSRPGSKLRLKGRGMPGNPRGDLYLVLELAMPDADDARTREAWRALAQAADFNPRQALG